MSEVSLGRTLGRTDQAIADWKKNTKVPKFAEQILRVVYAAHAYYAESQAAGEGGLVR